MKLNAKQKAALDKIKTAVTEADSDEARWTLIENCLATLNSATEMNIKDGAVYLKVKATKPVSTTVKVEKIEPDDITVKYNVAYACVLQTAIYIKGAVWGVSSPKALHDLIWSDDSKKAYRQYDDDKVTPSFFEAIGMVKVQIPTGTKPKDILTYLDADKRYAVSVRGSVEDHSLILDKGVWKEYRQMGSGTGFKEASPDKNTEIKFVYG